MRHSFTDLLTRAGGINDYPVSVAARRTRNQKGAISNGGTIYDSETTFVCNLSGLDADTTAVNIGHNIAPSLFQPGVTAPLIAVIQLLTVQANFPSWSVTLNATNAVVNKGNVVGSGGTNIARLVVMLPHSMI